MLQKLSFILVLAILLTACGASAPVELANDAAESFALLPGEGSTVPDSIYDMDATAEVCNAEYFRFQKGTNTVADENGQTILYENFSLADFTTYDPERSAWVQEVLGGIARDFSANSSKLCQYAAEFLKDGDSDLFYSYSNYQQLGVARHDDAVVSLIELSSLYSGGSHPNSVQTAYNLDVENLRLLRLEDVVAEDGARELAKLVRAEVDGKFTVIDGGNGLFEDYGDTIESSMRYGSMTPYWYLNDTGLVVFYNQYELGPYAAGIIKVELAYGALEGILREEYFPAEPDGTAGSLILRDSGEGWHIIPIFIEPEGEKLLVGVEGKAYQVQLSEVLWLDGTPISQELIFSARSLCRNDVLQITGGFDDDSRSFAIEFIDGRGEHHLYYLHPGALTKEP